MASVTVGKDGQDAVLEGIGPSQLSPAVPSSSPQYPRGLGALKQDAPMAGLLWISGLTSLCCWLNNGGMLKALNELMNPISTQYLLA